MFVNIFKSIVFIYNILTITVIQQRSPKPQANIKALFGLIFDFTIICVIIFSNIFFQPVKIGKPSLNGGISENLNNPFYSTAVGLLLYSMNNKQNPEQKVRKSTYYDIKTEQLLSQKSQELGNLLPI